MKDNLKELMPCPFCGGSDLVIRQDEAEDRPGFFYAYHVFCRDCHCHGGNNYPIGWCESEEDAADRWNLRGFKSYSARRKYYTGAE